MDLSLLIIYIFILGLIKNTLNLEPVTWLKSTKFTGYGENYQALYGNRVFNLVF